MPKKLTYIDIENRLNNEGYKLLNTIYKGNCLWKVEYVCPKNHKHIVSWSGWRQGKRCPHCYGNVKLTIGFVRSGFEKESYILLTKEYKNNYQKLEYICPKGHKHSISWNNWKKGSRCSYCAGQGKPSIEFIKSDFTKEGYELLTIEYKNSKQKLEYVCSGRHKHSITWNSWKKGNRCSYCYGNIKLIIEFVRSEFEKEGYQLLTTEYVNNRQKLDYICSKGHKHNINWGDWQSGYRCPYCYWINNTSSNNPNWKGGIACEPYCEVWLDKKYKEAIKARDNHQCQNLDCWGNSKRLCGHHIDYNKKNCDPFNVITICNSCNSRANADREYWTKFYQLIMNKKYGYNYGE